MNPLDNYTQEQIDRAKTAVCFQKGGVQGFELNDTAIAEEIERDRSARRDSLARSFGEGRMRRARRHVGEQFSDESIHEATMRHNSAKFWSQPMTEVVRETPVGLPELNPVADPDLVDGPREAGPTPFGRAVVGLLERSDDYQLNLNDLAKRAYQNAAAHGFDEPKLPKPHMWAPVGIRVWNELRARHFMSTLMLIATELAEAAEEIRKGNTDAFITEIADVLIRTLSMCGASDIDIQDAVIMKMRKNEGRPLKHGGKLI